jgi:CheY-like chemotaxis protein
MRQYERELKNALSRLYDANYQPSEALYELTGCEPQDGPLAVQSAIVEAIERLRPPRDIPPSSRPREIYELLRNRFVLDLTLEETAERMHLSCSTTWRRQRAAVHALARALWGQGQAQPQSETRRVRRVGEGPVHPQATDWASQAERELASLREGKSDTECELKEAIEDVLNLVDALSSQHDVRLKLGSVQPDLVTPIPASVLRQVLITAIGRLTRRASIKQITIFARLEDGNIVVTLTGPRSVQDDLTESELIRGMLAPKDVSVRARVDGDQVFLWAELPSIGEATVLVVDDNRDMMHFYRRATDGTSYRIVHVKEERRLFEVIETTAPDVIVLDIMLPEVDGWELLIRLYENPRTRRIPVIVCTVVRERDLALSLGAADYLLKPVRPSEFRQALDRALAQAPAGSSESPESTAADG